MANTAYTLSPLGVERKGGFGFRRKKGLRPISWLVG